MSNVDTLHFQYSALSDQPRQVTDGPSCVMPSLTEADNIDNILVDDLYLHQLQGCSHIASQFTVAQWFQIKFQLINLSKTVVNKNFSFHLFLTGSAGVCKIFFTKVLIDYLTIFCSFYMGSQLI